MISLHQPITGKGKIEKIAGASWPSFWDRPTTAQNATEARALISRCSQRRGAMLSALAKLRAAGAHSQARHMSRRYIYSYSARLNALARARVQKVGPLKDAHDSDLCKLVQEAAEVSAWRGSDETSAAFQKSKRGGGYRWVHAQGMIQYALGLLSADAALVMADLLPTQFMSNGGDPKFKLWLEENLPTAERVMTFDIPRCFDTLRRSSLVGSLRLPQQVVKSVLFDPMDYATYLYPGPVGLTPKPGPIAKVSSGSRGIPQGSALSQVASEIVIAKVMRSISEIHPSIRVASHGDNIIVLLGDASCEALVKSALTSSVTKNFGLDVSTELTCRIKCSAPAAGFEFCRRIYVYRKNVLKMRLPADWIADFEMKTLMRIERAFAMKKDDEWDRIERTIKGWLHQNPKSHAVIDAASELLAHVKIMRKGHNLLTPAEAEVDAP